MERRIQLEKFHFRPAKMAEPILRQINHRSIFSMLTIGTLGDFDYTQAQIEEAVTHGIEFFDLSLRDLDYFQNGVPESALSDFGNVIYDPRPIIKYIASRFKYGEGDTLRKLSGHATEVKSSLEGIDLSTPRLFQLSPDQHLVWERFSGGYSDRLAQVVEERRKAEYPAYRRRTFPN